MITGLDLENFKCFGRKVSIPFAPITLIVGENSSGKSSILQALYLLKQTREHAPQEVPLLFRCSAGFADLGNYATTVYDHDTSRHIRVAVHSDASNQTADAKNVGPRCCWSFDFGLKDTRTVIHGAHCQVAKQSVYFVPVGGDGTRMRGVEPIPAFVKIHKLLSDSARSVLPMIDRLLMRDVLQDIDPQGELYYEFMAQHLRTRLAAGQMRELASVAVERRWGQGHAGRGLHISAHEQPFSVPFLKRYLFDVLLTDTNRHGASAQKVRNVLEMHCDVVQRLTELPAFATSAERCRTKWDKVRHFYSGSFSVEELASRLGFGPGFDLSMTRIEPSLMPWPREALRRVRAEFLMGCTAILLPPDADNLRRSDDNELFSDPMAIEQWHFDSDRRRCDVDNYLLGLLNIDRDAHFASSSVAASSLINSISDVVCLAPIRSCPLRIYFDSGTRPGTVGYEGDHLLELLLADECVAHRCSDWLRRLTDYGIELRPLGDLMAYELALTDHRRDPPVRISVADVGYGVSQMLPVIVQSLASERKLITIEQPEVHIHPRLQAELGDLLAYALKERGNHFAIETHSEHLILRLLRLIRKKELSPDQVSVLFVSRGDEGSDVKRIRINEAGDFLDPWPGGFFPERMNEVFG